MLGPRLQGSNAHSPFSSAGGFQFQEHIVGLHKYRSSEFWRPEYLQSLAWRICRRSVMAVPRPLLTKLKVVEEANFLNYHFYIRITIKADTQIRTPCYHQHSLCPAFEEGHFKYIAVVASSAAGCIALHFCTDTFIQHEWKWFQRILYCIYNIAIPRSKPSLKTSYWSKDVRVTR